MKKTKIVRNIWRLFVCWVFRFVIWHVNLKIRLMTTECVQKCAQNSKVACVFFGFKAILLFVGNTKMYNGNNKNRISTKKQQQTEQILKFCSPKIKNSVELYSMISSQRTWCTNCCTWRQKWIAQNNVRLKIQSHFIVQFYLNGFLMISFHIFIILNKTNSFGLQLKTYERVATKIRIFFLVRQAIALFRIQSFV